MHFKKQPELADKSPQQLHKQVINSSANKPLKAIPKQVIDLPEPSDRKPVPIAKDKMIVVPQPSSRDAAQKALITRNS